MLITSVKRDRRASRQERKKQNNKIKKKHNTHTHTDNGILDRPRASKLFKDRLAVSTLPATKLHFHTGKKKQ